MILAYHRISTVKPDHYLLRHLFVEPSMFEKQVVYLKKNYRVVSLDEFECLFTRKAFHNCVVITFDDGYEDTYRHAFPILKKHHLPATVFPTTAYLGTRRAFWWERLSYILLHARTKRLRFRQGRTAFNIQLKTPAMKQKAFFALSALFKDGNEADNNATLQWLSEKLGTALPENGSRKLQWKQVREMAGQRIGFGAHTETHPRLAHMDGFRLDEELSGPKKTLEENLGREIRAFAYPYGSRADFGTRSRKALIRAGYKIALTMTNMPVDASSDPYALPRMAAHPGNEFRFRLRLRKRLLIPPQDPAGAEARPSPGGTDGCLAV